MRQSEFIKGETVKDICLPGHMQRFSVLICSLAYVPECPTVMSSRCFQDYKTFHISCGPKQI